MTPDQELTDLHPSGQELSDYGLGRLATRIRPQLEALEDRPVHRLRDDSRGRRYRPRPPKPDSLATRPFF